MKRILLFTYLLGLMAFAPGLHAQDYETLTHVNGCNMRATPVIISKVNFVSPNLALAMRPQFYPALKRIDVNAIRLCWVGPWFDYQPNPSSTWTIDELLPVMDSIINMATRAELMTIINYHATGEYQNTQGFGRMVPFWEAVASRYADNEYVVYEIANEQAFGAQTYLTPAFKNVTRSIYEQIRTDAPERQIILFSWNALNKPMKMVADNYSDFVDWEYTSVGWHFYGGQNNTQSSEEANLIELMENYRSICTEWDYFRDGIDDRPTPTYIKEFFGNRLMAHSAENLGISWVDWRGWNDATFNEWNEALLPDADTLNYAWDNAACDTTSTSTAFFRNNDELNIYPTPTGNILYVDAAAFFGNGAELSIYDLTGKLLRTQKVTDRYNDHAVNVSKLKPGQYFLVIRGERNYAKRFVKR